MDEKSAYWLALETPDSSIAGHLDTYRRVNFEKGSLTVNVPGGTIDPETFDRLYAGFSDAFEKILEQTGPQQTR